MASRNADVMGGGGTWAGVAAHPRWDVNGLPREGRRPASKFVVNVRNNQQAMMYLLSVRTGFASFLSCAFSPGPEEAPTREGAAHQHNRRYRYLYGYCLVRELFSATIF